MRSSALARSLGAGALFACSIAGLQEGCVNRQTPAKFEAADASLAQDAMRPPDTSIGDGSGTPSNVDQDGGMANDDAAPGEENPAQPMASDDGGADASDDGGADASDDGEADAGGDADRDGGQDADAAAACDSLTPTECLLESKRGPECRMCAQGQCADPNLQCEHLAGHSAVSGPSAGQSRQDLCLATLSCILTTKCYKFGAGVDPCYCGSEGLAACLDAGPARNAAAFCRSAEENGLETLDPGVALGSLTDANFGAGTANAMQLCLELKCSNFGCF
jgi:hypothetical protein